jgi:hypothetical protein
MLSTADEENNGTYGIRWMIDNHFTSTLNMCWMRAVLERTASCRRQAGVRHRSGEK